ncbi:hypothetical protein SNOG_01550 [Parastagonospora nodorum SN15]|uniref:Uncharacterized protein n=1 Tax=Phaeosphaeria nodorum (strain SN15 / ATCC MYA-4574 / FGSC 10173) TaxID=321614 RepID=Q0V364_PHANO|nr:hypothetical protein SNOG_01550 [Parastagonospora nodorum SN15]EAT91199.1 hypothetical protein SNOG_01550 [Parastagonospora nodorum SN15]
MSRPTSDPPFLNHAHETHHCNSPTRVQNKTPQQAFMIDSTYLATLTLLACASALVLAAMLYPAALLR